MAESINWKRVAALWRASGRTRGTIQVYTYWARRYVRYCVATGQAPLECLTRAHVLDYVGREIPVARRRRRGRTLDVRVASNAVRALWCSLGVLGHQLPPWRAPKPEGRMPPLVRSFVDFRVRHQGVAVSTVARDSCCAIEFLDWLRRRNRDVSRTRVVDVDDFVTEYARRCAPKTVAGTCSSLRAFLRYLHVTERLAVDVASSVLGPRVRSGDRPPRALPWRDVQRILRAIDVDTSLGRRDFALFLMMASYGMGAAEVLGLCVDDFDWRNRTVVVRRPKTGTTTTLPLLPIVARALASYLRRGRPAHSRERTVFVSHRMPHTSLTSSAIRHRLREHARAAGVTASFLGSHVFRHSHATRQIEHGVTPKVVGDILGHRRPESTSTYVRGAVLKLRTVSLPVPR